MVSSIFALHHLLIHFYMARITKNIATARIIKTRMLPNLRESAHPANLMNNVTNNAKNKIPRIIERINIISLPIFFILIL